MRNRNIYNAGFTLLELLITLAVITLLVCIALPNYSHHLTAVRRTNVTTVLYDTAGRMEQFYTQNNSYEGATLIKLGVDQNKYASFYQVTIDATTDSYALNAAPIGQQARSDKLCSTLNLDHQGKRTISGTGSLRDCW